MTGRDHAGQSPSRAQARGPSDYEEIRQDHKRRYGTDIAEFGPRLFDEQYADPRHFLLELLQNAEDALARRKVKPPFRERSVTFKLTEDALRFRHFGDPFDPEDVKSICGIGKSTKGLENIGRFGLGFKSVYAFTDRPEIHSGPEDFVIRNYVWPEAAAPVQREDGETVILLPRKPNSADWASLARGLPEMLSGPYLLFLRHIESVRWSAPNGSEAEFLRQSQPLEPGVRRVTLVGGTDERDLAGDSEWLIFERPVCHDGCAAGRVEVAFAIDSDAQDKGVEFLVRPLSGPSLYAFFPTDKETHLGFHVHGPYNTTPARDNVRWPDQWNHYLVGETALLVRSALAWFRDHCAVSVALLKSLPLKEEDFTATMFLPLFEGTRTALRDDGVLPTESGLFASASHARLGRGERLRRLFSPEELGELCSLDESVHWLPGEITEDRAPMLRQYLQKQLEIEELDPESVVNHLTERFLGQRSDAWIHRLYEFLADQSGFALRRSLRTKPVLRLDNKGQVCPPGKGQQGVFFPGDTKTGFQTIRESVCQGVKARKFLEDLGVREPDFVDDVVRNVLDKYADGRHPLSISDYAEDLARIWKAYQTDSREAQRRLIDALKGTQWVRAVDGSGREAGWRFPRELYLPLPALRDLFENLERVIYASPDAFDGEWMARDGLLETVGVLPRLRRIKAESDRDDVRALLDQTQARWRGGTVTDWTLEGLDEVLSLLPRLPPVDRSARSAHLWNALREYAQSAGAGSHWSGFVRWFYYTDRSRAFDAAFLVALRDSAWVSDPGGVLRRPKEVVFSSLDWPDDPGLREKLGFLSDEDKQHRERDEMLTILEEWGVRTPDELRSRWAAIPDVPAADPAPTVALSEVAEWWADAKAEQRRRYREAAFPETLDVASLAGEDRVGWFTFFALACFRSYGRTTEAQHRGFVDRGVREGWWTELAESSPPGNTAAWLDRLQAWSSADQPSQVFGMWRGSFVALYTVARWLDGYARLMLKLPDIIADMDGRVSLRELMNPAHSPAVRRLGVDAAPLARTLGIGVNWMIRELLRAGVYRRGVMAPYAWMSSRRVRDFLVRAGGPALDEADPDHSGQIHEFVGKELGSEAAEFDGDYDLPLQLRTDHGWR